MVRYLKSQDLSNFLRLIFAKIKVTELFVFCDYVSCSGAIAITLQDVLIGNNSEYKYR